MEQHRLDRDHVGRHRGVAQQRHLTEAGARAQPRHRQILAFAGRHPHFGVAGDQHVEAAARITLTDDHLVGLILLLHPDAGQVVEHLFVQQGVGSLLFHGRVRP